MQRRKRTELTLVQLIPAALLLAGCLGGGEDDEGDAARPTNDAPPADTHVVPDGGAGQNLNIPAIDTAPAIDTTSDVPGGEPDVTTPAPDTAPPEDMTSADTGPPPLPTTCAAAIELTNGLVLRNQGGSAALYADDSDCKHGGMPVKLVSLYYTLTLRHQETATISVQKTAMTQVVAPEAVLIVRESCETRMCTSRSDTPLFPIENKPHEFTWSNDDPTTKHLVLEIAWWSTAPTYDLSVTITRTPAAVVVTTPSSATTSEGGQQSTFTVALSSPPTANVTVPLSSSAPDEGTVSPATLTFTPANWATPQTVTVTGVDDNLKDGAQPYTIRLEATTSADPRWQGVDGPDVPLTNHDDDASFRFDDIVGLVTSESGASTTFGVALSSAPSAAVHVALSSSDTGEGTVSPAELVFTPANWNTLQTVTLTGVADHVRDGTQPFSVVFAPATSDDAAYAGVDPDDVAATNRDDDFETVAQQTLVTNPDCLQSALRLAASDAGVLYFGYSCSGPSYHPVSGAANYLLISRDGGKTWSEKRDLSPSGTDLALVAGPPGILLRTASDPYSLSALLLRSEDEGVTWTEMGKSPNDINGYFSSPVMKGKYAALLEASRPSVIWSSVDAGKTWKRYPIAAPTGYEFTTGSILGLQEDGTIDIAQLSWRPSPNDGAMDLCLRRSQNHGQSFGACLPVPENAAKAWDRDTGFGRKRVVTRWFGSADKVGVGPIAQPSLVGPVGSYTVSTSAPRPAIDPTDTVVVVSVATDKTVMAHWLAPGETSLSAPVAAGKSSTNHFAALPISDRAVLVATRFEQGLVVSLARRP